MIDSNLLKSKKSITVDGLSIPKSKAWNHIHICRVNHCLEKSTPCEKIGNFLITSQGTRSFFEGTETHKAMHSF